MPSLAALDGSGGEQPQRNDTAALPPHLPRQDEPSRGEPQLDLLPPDPPRAEGEGGPAAAGATANTPAPTAGRWPTRP